MSHTEGDLIAMQQNLGLGHKGEIILTTQLRVDENQPIIAKDVIDKEHAERLALCWNSHDALLAACKTGLAYVYAIISKVPRSIQDLREDKEQLEAAIKEVEK